MLPSSVSFARPSFLYLLVLVLVLGALAIVAARRRRAALSRFGRPHAVAVISSLRRGERRRSRIALFFGLIALIVAVAGPRWGKGGETGVVIGRDVLVVFDLSRSMTAADMADPTRRERWQAGRAGIHAMIDQMQAQGGHRVGLVVFAARPILVCPLTSDFDHFRARLDEFSPTAPPPEVRPDPEEELVSGTGIGAALQEAIAAHDPRFPGYQDIILVSDGDGPEVEREIEAGIRAALRAVIPVHAVGVGDPAQPTVIVLGEGDSAELVSTQLRESILKETARRTNGEYLAARREVPPMGDWFARIIGPRPSRELADDAIPQPKDRSAWFAALGLLFLFIAWCLER